MKMKGFAVTAPSTGFYGEVERPVLKPGQALIKVKYAGVCAGDPGHFARNFYKGTPEDPRIYGHEYYGEVVEINNPYNIPTRIKLGDMVVGPQNAPCGVCDQCMEGRFSLCSAQYGAKRRPGGTFGEYLERDLDKLFPIKEGVDPLVAAVAEPLAIGVYDVRNSGVGLGDNVLIIGAGAVGMIIGIVARNNGANVYYSELSDIRIQTLEEMGFKAFNSMKEDVVAKVMELTGTGMDYVFEISGSQPGWDMSFEVAKPRGHVIPVGLPNPHRDIHFSRIVEKELDVRCMNMHHLNDFAEAVNLINRGDVNKELRRLVTSIWPMSKTREALEASTDKSGNELKILLSPDVDEVINTIEE